MNRAAFDAKLLALLAEAVPARFRKTAITEQTRLKQELGLDSIGMLALWFRFEQAFGLDLASIDVGTTLEQMRTVGDALATARLIFERTAALEPPAS
jgi:acyl carrier protein